VSRISFEAESSSRSAWNARTAVVRCSGARVFRTPSHVNAGFTAAIVVRSRLAALGEVWVVGWLVDRLVDCWPVTGSVVVAVDIDFRVLSGQTDSGNHRVQLRSVSVPFFRSFGVCTSYLSAFHAFQLPGTLRTSLKPIRSSRLPARLAL